MEHPVGMAGVFSSSEGDPPNIRKLADSSYDIRLVLSKSISRC